MLAIQQRIELLQAGLEQCYDERAALVLSLCGEYTTRDIAVLLDCSQPNVIHMMNRARGRTPARRGTAGAAHHP